MSHKPVINVQVGFEIDHRELEAPLCTRRTSAGHSLSSTLFGAALHRCLIGCTWMARSVRKLDCPPDSRTEMPTRPSTLISKLLLQYCGCCVGPHRSRRALLLLCQSGSADASSEDRDLVLGVGLLRMRLSG